jgi:MFS family permease
VKLGAVFVKGPTMPSPSRSTAGLLVVGIGTLAAPLDSAVNIAFPSITTAFGLAVEDIRWVIVSYVLTYSSLMLVFGKLGDLVGYRRIFQAGLAVAGLGFAGCALAPSLDVLLAARLVQGIGVALVLSCGPALATSLHDESERTRVLGAYAAMTAVGAALGPVAGGLLVDRFGWSAVFWARIPLVALALALSWVIPAAHNRARGAFDAAGAALLIGWMCALLLALTLHATPFGAVLPLALAAAGALLLVAFLAHERRHPEPIIRPSLFRNAGFLVMNLASIAVNMAAFSIMLLVPFFLARTAGLASGQGGLVLALAAIGAIAGSWLAGRIGARTGPGRLALAGAVLCVLGLLSISTWTPATPPPAMALALLAQGLGVGLFQVAYADLVMATLPVEDRGVAGSLTMVTRTVGIVGAANGLSALHRALEAAAAAGGAGPEAAFLAGFQWSFALVAAGLALALALCVVGWRMRIAPGPRPRPAGRP